jgi:hypothetical protein
VTTSASGAAEAQELLDRIPSELSDAAVAQLVSRFPCCLGTGRRPGGRGYCDCLNGAIVRKREEPAEASGERRAKLEAAARDAAEEEADRFLRVVTAECLELQRQRARVGDGQGRLPLWS